MPTEIYNKGSLMTFFKDGKEHHLNYIFCAEGKGCFEPDLGKVEVTLEEAEKHNTLLAEAEVKGLDEMCAIGQGRTFYVRNGIATTWTGLSVGPVEKFGAKRLKLTRNGRVFIGIPHKNEDAVFFERTS